VSNCKICPSDEFHCMAAHALGKELADRIAKLEARDREREHFNCSHGADASDCPKTAAAGPIPIGYRLADGWELGNPSEASCTHRGAYGYWDCNRDAVYVNGVGACAAHAIEMGALVKVEPPAEPVSAADELPRSALVCVCSTDECCVVCEPDNPEAQVAAQGAPAEPLRCWCGDVLSARMLCGRHGGPQKPRDDWWIVTYGNYLPDREKAIARLKARLSDAIKRIAELTDEEACARGDIAHLAEKLAAAERDEEARRQQYLAAIERAEAAERERDEETERANEADALESRLAAVEILLAAAEREREHWKQARENALKAGELLLEERDAALAGKCHAESARRAAEKERDEANRKLADTAGALATEIDSKVRAMQAVDKRVAAECERCLYHVETYEPRRDAPVDWTYQGALIRVAEAIRDGRKAE
jgi:hypothetical protein